MAHLRGLSRTIQVPGGFRSSRARRLGLCNACMGRLERQLGPCEAYMEETTLCGSCPLSVRLQGLAAKVVFRLQALR